MEIPGTVRHYLMAAGEDIRGRQNNEIRSVTYLSPSIPRAVFEGLADHVRRATGCGRVSLRLETRASGPEKGDERLFSSGEADVGFMCAPSYVCDVVVREDRQIRSFAGLRGGSWLYNDACSLSGYFSLLKKLAESGADERFFDSVSCSGSHLNSIEAVLHGDADAAAIDSNVLRIRLREVPDLREKLRVIETWGPFPIQPVVVRSTLHPHLKERLRAAFLTTEEDESTRRILERYGLSRFVAVGRQDYSLDAHKDLAALLTAR
ncbi:MAG: PhnD/SsuA/transferrin family substrate-binding protein [Rubrobacteraceae bacterium]|nr:PhnD/SsuA/transferrin family substrate-binding protein [Rubrobacteraceae bacterium]